jgi:tetratricopeptide (TPR) repeat protein
MARLFVSSTFKDMQKERDVLARSVFPQMRELLTKRGFSLFEVDLRWGVTPEESETDRAVAICLEEIDQCRPFFIGMLGERYGWRPANLSKIAGPGTELAQSLSGNISVTELEMRYAVLNAPRNRQVCTPIFMLRSPQLSAAWGHEPDAPSELDALKREIRKRFGVMCHEYGSLEDFEGNLLSRLTREFQTLTPRMVRWSPNPDDLPRTSALKGIEKAAAGRRPTLLTAPRGAGASWLATRWAHQGNSVPLIVDGRRLGRGISVASALSQRMESIGTWASGQSASVDDDFALAICQLGRRRKEHFRIVFDHVDEAVLDKAQLDLSFVPSRLPSNVNMLLIARSDRLRAEASQNGWRTAKILAVSEAERREYVQRRLRSFGKKLTPTQLHTLARAPHAANIGLLNLIVDELRRFGLYDQLDARLARLSLAQSEEALAREIISGLASIVPDRYPNAVQSVLGALALSVEGLEEREICAAAGTGDQPLPANFWAAVRLGLGRSLTTRGARFYLADGPVYALAAELAQSSVAAPAARRLDSFLRQASPRRWAEESPNLVTAFGGVDAWSDRLSDPGFAALLLDAGPTYAGGVMAQMSPAASDRVIEAWTYALAQSPDPALAWRLGLFSARLSRSLGAVLLRLDTRPLEADRAVIAATISGDWQETTVQRVLTNGPKELSGTEALWIGSAAVITAVLEGAVSLSPQQATSWMHVMNRAAREMGTPSHLAQAAQLCGRQAIKDGRYATASRWLERAIRQSRRAGHGRRLIDSLLAQAGVSIVRNNFSAARTAAREAAELAMRLGLARPEMAALETLVEVERRRANWAEAYALAKRMFDRAGGDSALIAQAQATLNTLEVGAS